LQLDGNDLERAVVHIYNVHKVHTAAPFSASLALSQTPAYTARPRYGASASRGVPVYAPAFACIHCAFPRRALQAELTWVACVTNWQSEAQRSLFDGLE